MIERKVGFIGAGLMAEALVRGMLAAPVADTKNICASDPSPDRRKVFEEILGGAVLADNTALVAAVEVVVLSVKPQVIPAVVDEIASGITADHLVVSIAPGVSLDWLKGKLGTGRLVRVMPNTPALVGAGASAYSPGDAATEEDAGLVEEILKSVGTCVRLEEKLMDAVTGLSGSGPAYVYMAIEALSDGGVKMGLPRATATRLAAQTVLGAAKMVMETGKHPGQLKDQVTTPGGTTIEGVHVLEQAGLRKAFMNAVVAAAEKCRRLGEKNKA